MPFARIRCPDCGEERLLMFSCRTRGFCPSCHAKRLEEWGERTLAWRHTGFNVHSLVRARTRVEAEPVGKYMIRPLLSLERLSLGALAITLGLHRHGYRPATASSCEVTMGVVVDGRRLPYCRRTPQVQMGVEESQKSARPHGVKYNISFRHQIPTP